MADQRIYSQLVETHIEGAFGNWRKTFEARERPTTLLTWVPSFLRINTTLYPGGHPSSYNRVRPGLTWNSVVKDNALTAFTIRAPRRIKSSLKIVFTYSAWMQQNISPAISRSASWICLLHEINYLPSHRHHRSLLAPLCVYRLQKIGVFCQRKDLCRSEFSELRGTVCHSSIRRNSYQEIVGDHHRKLFKKIHFGDFPSRLLHLLF